MFSHMSSPPEQRPFERAETRQQRLHVADALEVVRDRTGANALLIGEQARRRFGPPEGPRKPLSAAATARQHGVVRALDARNVHEARAASDQRAAREGQLRDGLPAALGDGARAIADALAAFQNGRDERGAS